MRIDSSDWKTLKEEIEKKLRIEGQATNYKTSKITSQQGVRSSTSNLNKIWGKDVEDSISMNDGTLSDLISILDYKSWEEYKRHLDQKILKSVESAGIYYPVDVDISKMENQIITLGWENKYSKIRVIDGFECEVIESKNMKKEAGERFVTLGFSLKENPPGLPYIMLDDFGDGYFDTQKDEFGVQFGNDYFYL